MFPIKKDTALHDLFILGIFIKGIDGALELIGGIILISIPSHSVASVVQSLFSTRNRARSNRLDCKLFHSIVTKFINKHSFLCGSLFDHSWIYQIRIIFWTMEQKIMGLSLGRLGFLTLCNLSFDAIFEQSLDTSFIFNAD